MPNEKSGRAFAVILGAAVLATGGAFVALLASSHPGAVPGREVRFPAGDFVWELTVDGVDGEGGWVRLEAGELLVELRDGAIRARRKRELLAEARLAESAGGRLWLRRSRGRVDVFLDRTCLLRALPDVILEARSGRAAAGGGFELRRSRVQPLGRIFFADEFAREKPGAEWRVLRGEWELSGRWFAERSANAFTLRARFGDAAPDPIVADRLKPVQTGLGIHLGTWYGLPGIERITGGGPAAEAGMREQDIIVEVDGKNVLSTPFAELAKILRGPAGKELNLKILRPGEEEFRELKIVRGRYRWGEIATSAALPGSARASPALIATGRKHWFDYVAKVSARLHGRGGMGLVFDVAGEDDYCVFRAVADGAAEELQLVRVKGREELIARRSQALVPQSYYRLGVAVGPEEVKCLLDGEEVLRARIDSLAGGKVGLWAKGPDVVEFDDFLVASDREKSLPKQRKISPILSKEADMHNWADPADEWEADYGTGWYWNIFPLPRDCSVSLDGAEFERLEVVLCAKDRDPDSGVRFVLGKTEAVIREGGRELARAGLFPSRVCRVRVSGARASIEVGGREVLSAKVRSKGEAAGFCGLVNVEEPGVVLANSARVIEYDFSTAPVDWLATSGLWGVVNKWMCDPRWSWFGGRSKTLASVWNKRVFRGDLRLDFFAALMMTSHEPPYERVGDFNCTILGRRFRMNTGYSLVVSGGGNLWTRLYRDGRPVAETMSPDFLLPSNVMKMQPKPHLHQRWFHITLEKRGNRVSYYLDGKKGFEFVDDEPLNEGQVALWTAQNGFLISRLRITFEEEAGVARLEEANSPYEDAKVTNIVQGVAASRVELKSRAGPGGEDVYRVETPLGGGAVALVLKEAVPRIDSTGRVRFKFRASRRSSVDLYLFPLDCRVRLTGPPEDEDRPAVWDAGVKADGEWHEVTLDLGRAWAEWKYVRPEFPRRAGRLRLAFGSALNGSYELAGFGANPPGSWYELCGIELGGPGRDEKPPRLSFEGVNRENPGILYFRLADEGSGLDIPRLVAVIGGVTCRASPWLPGEARLRLSPRGGLAALSLKGLDLQSVGALGVKFAGLVDRAGNAARNVQMVSPVPRRDPWPPAVTAFGFVGREKAFRCGFELGEAVPAGSFRGFWARPPERALDTSTSSSGRTSLKLVSPSVGSRMGLVLAGGGGGGGGGGGVDLEKYPVLSFDYRIPPEMPFNLLLDVPGGWDSIALTDVHDKDCHWSYRTNHLGRANVVADDRWHHVDVNLLDFYKKGHPNSPRARVKRIVLADFGWHGIRRGGHYWLDNVALVPALKPGDIRPRWRAWDLGEIVDFRASLAERPAEPRGRLSFPGGGGGCGPGYDASKPLDELDAEKLGEGLRYLNLSLIDESGNRSPARSFPVYVDSRPPEVVEFSPYRSQRSGARKIVVLFRDATGVRPRSLVVELAGLRRRPGEGMSYDRREEKLTIDISEQAKDFAPGQEIEVVISSAEDLVGNALNEPFRWSWVFDPSADERPPRFFRARLTCASKVGRSSPFFLLPRFTRTNDFEFELGQLEARRGCTVERTDLDSAFGKYSALMTVGDDWAGKFRLQLFRMYWWWKNTPFLSFDYKLVGEFEELRLSIDVLGEVVSIPLSHRRADGIWHRYVLDARPRIGRARIRRPLDLARFIRLEGRARPGSRVWLDNVELADLRWSNARVEWEKPEDDSGVRDYHLLFDEEPSTVPPERPAPPGDAPALGTVARTDAFRVPGRARRVFIPNASERKGLKFLHIRPRDWSGNWGGTFHCVVDFGPERQFTTEARPATSSVEARRGGMN